MNNRSKGIEGENLAAEYLKKQGYRILERNFNTKVGEIDIIAEDKNTLVFVEVKTRENTAFGQPIESITRNKVRSIVRTAQLYILSHKRQNSFCRFDIVEVLRGEVIHTKDAFTM